MAEVPVNRSVPSGYDEQFVYPPDEDLQCIICYLPSKEPVLTRCGHKFSRQCLRDLTHQTGTRPLFMCLWGERTLGVRLRRPGLSTFP